MKRTLEGVGRIVGKAFMLHKKKMSASETAMFLYSVSKT